MNTTEYDYEYCWQQNKSPRSQIILGTTIPHAAAVQHVISKYGTYKDINTTWHDDVATTADAVAVAIAYVAAATATAAFNA